jgi:ABC-type transport system substrate-binding protein
MKKMRKIAYFSIVACFLLTLTFAAPRIKSSPETMGPVMDDVYFVMVQDPYGAIDAWKAGTVDICEVPEFGMIPELEGPPYEGYVQNIPSWVFEYYDWNVEGWKVYPEHGYPLNDTHFRRATAYLTNTEGLIATDPWFTGFCRRDYGSWLPEQYGEWSNPNVQEYPYDWDAALAEMAAGGFTYVLKSGYTEPEPGGIDHWNDPQGSPLRSFTMDTTSKWLYYMHIADAWLTELQAFGFDVTAVYQDWGPYQAKVWAGDFDFHVLGTVWSRIDPIIMNFYFDPDNAPPGCCNWRYWSDPEADAWIETYSSTLDRAEAVEAAWNLLDKIAEECIMAPALTWVNIFTNNKDLQGFRKSAAWSDWNFQFFQAKWKTEEAKTAHNNALRARIAGDPAGVDLNPYVQVGAWESSFLGLIHDSYGGGFGLTAINPVTFEPMPWLAEDWTVESVPSGTTITYYLRDDVYWHDGVQFTSEDVKFSLESLKDWGSAAGQAVQACGNLWKVETEDVDDDGWNEAIVYQNVSNLFVLQYTSMWGGMVAKHVWEPVIAGEDEIYGTEDDVDPRTVPAWNTPNPIDPSLTLLTGTGPWIFNIGDWHTGEYIRLRANRNYFKSAEQSLADVNFDFKTDILDIATAAKAFGAKRGDARWELRADINNDKQINILDIATIAMGFGKTW